MASQKVSKADLLGKLDAPRPESYRFTEAGQVLSGTVAGLDVGTTYEGDRVRIVVIDPDDGNPPCSVWLLHDAMRSQMNRIRPRIGERLAIRYNGKIMSRNERPYHSYTVVSDREAGADWDDDLSADDWAGAKADEKPPF